MQKNALNEHQKNSQNDDGIPLSLTTSQIINDSSWLADYSAETFEGFFNIPDTETLLLSIKGYEQLLFMCAKFPDLVSVINPTMAVSLVIAAHQSCPISYFDDCMKYLKSPLFGLTTWQDVNNEQRKESCKLLTQTMWEKEFLEKLFMKREADDQ